jgi:hypothetical protein
VGAISAWDSSVVRLGGDAGSEASLGIRRVKVAAGLRTLADLQGIAT